MRQSAISFESKGVTLEGVVAVPEGDVGPLAGVVICHPHPLRGGNMDNNVVLSVCPHSKRIRHSEVQFPGRWQQRRGAHRRQIGSSRRSLGLGRA